MKFLSKYNKIVGELQWRYFIGEYKPKQQDKMEKQFKTLTPVDQDTARELSVLLNNIDRDKELRQELGLDPYNLYPIGLSSFVNFRDLSNLVTYKVHDLTQSGQLFGTVLAKGKKQYSTKDIEAYLSKELPENKGYLNNFDRSYILVKLPDKMNDKSIDFNALFKPLEFKSNRFVKDTNTFIIEVK